MAMFLTSPFLFPYMPGRRRDKRIKHWMADVWTGLKFWMKLPRNKEWMIF